MLSMKRVLSFLLLIPFFVTQAWAIRGGPYDSPFGYSQAPLSGTYGVSLDGVGAPVVDDANPASQNAARPAALDPLSSLLSTTGVMTISVPTSGLTQSRVLVFERGLFYFGSAYGRLDFQSGSMRLLAQLSHYLTADTLATDSASYFLVVDYMLSGQIDLQLSMDYFSGVIQVGGSAVFALTNLPLGFNQYSSGTDAAASDSNNIANTKTVQTVTNLNETITDATINGGTSQIRTTTTESSTDYNPEAFDSVRKPAVVFYMAASGVREDTIPITLPTFNAPTPDTGLQFGVTTTTTTGAGN